MEFDVVVYKTDKREIVGTNNSHLFAHELFEFSHGHFDIRLICVPKPPIFDYVYQKDETVCWLWAPSSG